jgi:hypothetical protein
MAPPPMVISSFIACYNDILFPETDEAVGQTSRIAAAWSAARKNAAPFAPCRRRGGQGCAAS